MRRPPRVQERSVTVRPMRDRIADRPGRGKPARCAGGYAIGEAGLFGGRAGLETPGTGSQIGDVRRRVSGSDVRDGGPVPEGRPGKMCRFEKDATMRTFDLTPLYRSTVGFDRLASILDQVMAADVGQNSYPPYNIEKTGENAYRITLAVAGFSDDELSIEFREGQLVVTGRKAEVEDKAQRPAPRHRHPRLRAPLPARRPCARRRGGDRERPAAHRPRARGPRGAEAAQDRDRARQGDREPGRRGVRRAAAARSR